MNHRRSPRIRKAWRVQGQNAPTDRCRPQKIGFPEQPPIVRTLVSATSVAVLLTCETCGQWSYCHNSKPSKLFKLEPKTKVKQTTLYKGAKEKVDPSKLQRHYNPHKSPYPGSSLNNRTEGTDTVGPDWCLPLSTSQLADSLLLCECLFGSTNTFLASDSNPNIST